MVKAWVFELGPAEQACMAQAFAPASEHRRRLDHRPVSTHGRRAHPDDAHLE